MARVKMAKSDPPLIEQRWSEFESFRRTDVYYRFLPHQVDTNPFLGSLRLDTKVADDPDEDTSTQQRSRQNDLVTSCSPRQETTQRNFETHGPFTEEMSYKDNP